MGVVPNNGAFETIGAAVWMKIFDIVYYCHVDPLLRVGQNNNS